MPAPRSAFRAQRSGDRPRRVAIVMNLEYALKRHQEIFAGAYRYARQRGWQVDAMPFSHQLVSSGREHLDYDGVIARVDRKLAAIARADRVPLVNVWYSSPVRGLPRVSIDVARVGTMAADHLRSRGFRRFATVGFARIAASVDAERGFCDELADSRATVAAFKTTLDFTGSPRIFARFEKALGTWLDGLVKPVGVFVTEDALARHLVNAALVRGIQIPADMAIVGTNNDEPYCLLSEPTISSIECGYDRVGYEAARMLDDLMAGKPAPAAGVVLPPKQLIPRDTSDVFASDDEMVARALRFISDNCHRPINVSDVVARLKVCGRTLARRFRKVRGCRVTDELARMRITRAKRMLAERDVSIRRVAAECGFSNSTQFIMAFRRLERMTPGEFRVRA